MLHTGPTVRFVMDKGKFQLTDYSNMHKKWSCTPRNYSERILLCMLVVRKLCYTYLMSVHISNSPPWADIIQQRISILWKGRSMYSKGFFVSVSVIWLVVLTFCTLMLSRRWWSLTKWQSGSMTLFCLETTGFSIILMHTVLSSYMGCRFFPLRLISLNRFLNHKTSFVT